MTMPRDDSRWRMPPTWTGTSREGRPARIAERTALVIEGWRRLYENGDRSLLVRLGILPADS